VEVGRYSGAGRTQVFSRSLDGDPGTNPEEKLVDDYRAPGDDLNPFPDGVYYVSWNADSRGALSASAITHGKNQPIVLLLPGPVGSPQDLAVSPNRQRMVYHELSGLGTDLSVIEFQ
jgi:hypothetical protein